MASWGSLGFSSSSLWLSWGSLGTFWALLGLSCPLLGAVLGSLGALLGSLGRLLGSLHPKNLTLQLLGSSNLLMAPLGSAWPFLGSQKSSQNEPRRRRRASDQAIRDVSWKLLVPRCAQNGPRRPQLAQDSPELIQKVFRVPPK